MSSATSSASGSGSNDEIRANLKSHNDSFDQLLRYIPAKFYIAQEEEETEPIVPLTKSQKQAAKKKSQTPVVKAAKSDALKKAKLARYDPAEPKTILEIQQAKLDALAKGKERAEGSGDEWESEGEGEDDDEEDSSNDTDFADSDTETTNGPLGKLTPRPVDEPAPSITELRDKLQKRIADIQAAKKSSDGSAGAKAGDEAGVDGEGSAQSREELLELRRKQRGLVRDNRRKKRKAERREEKPKTTERVASNGRKGGGKANAPPKEPREEQQDDEDRPRKKSKATPPTKKTVVAPVTAVVVAPPAPAPVAVVKVKAAAPSTDPSQLSFSTLDFSTTALLAANASSSLLKPKKNRHTLPKDPNAALAVLAVRKERLEALNPEQRERAEEKARWEKVELKAGGEKVRDDEKRLKKMAKRQETGKAKSAKAWAERKETVSSTQTAKIAKRNSNLAARVKQAKDKKVGIKTKSKMVKTVSKAFANRDKSGGRPGFK